MLYIFDIDGVLADVTHLLPLITGENKDYDAYYSRIGEALPIANGLRLAQTFFSQEADKRYIYDVLMSRQSPNSKRVSWLGVIIPPELISSFIPKGIHFVTGRSEKSREATKQWLAQNGICTQSELDVLLRQKEVQRRCKEKVDLDICRDEETCWGDTAHLYMRGNTDRRPAYQVKRGIVERIHKETDVPYAKMTVFEDDPQCAEMYESLGCYVCHVRHSKAKS